MERREIILQMETEGGERGAVRIREGAISEALLEDGRRGDEAVNHLLDWHAGTFSAHFGTGSVQLTIEPAATHARSVASRSVASGPVSSSPAAAFTPPAPAPAASAPPPAMARPATAPAPSAAETSPEGTTPEDGPPASEPTTPAVSSPPVTDPAGEEGPTRAATAQECLTLLNVLSSVLLAGAPPQLVDHRLTESRTALLSRYQALRLFQVQPGPLVALVDGWRAQLEQETPRSVAQAVGVWSRELLLQMQRAAPAPLPEGMIRDVLGSAGPSLSTLGFLEAFRGDP
jgi:hypothetical protein